MKPRQGLYAILSAVGLAAICMGAAGAAPTSTHTSIPQRWKGSYANLPVPTPPATWFGQYYDNMVLQGRPVMLREDPAIDFDWGPGSPTPQLKGDLFSARWTRSLWLGAGTWRFTTRTDDGVRLWVDNILVINQWHAQPSVK